MYKNQTVATKLKMVGKTSVLSLSFCCNCFFMFYTLGSLPYRQLRKQYVQNLSSTSSSLPYRQLRNSVTTCHWDQLCSLPYRQLRNDWVKATASLTSSLPYRQLRKEETTDTLKGYCSLPYRQLRKPKNHLYSYR